MILSWLRSFRSDRLPYEKGLEGALEELWKEGEDFNDWYLNIHSSYRIGDTPSHDMYISTFGEIDIFYYTYMGKDGFFLKRKE